VVALFGCHIKCILYRYLQTGDYLKNEESYSASKVAVVFLKMKTSVSFDELCKECYAMKPTLALFLNEESLLKERDILKKKAKSTKHYVFNSKE